MRIYIETYGCQMNMADSEIVASILKHEGYDLVTDLNKADIIFINTCSIRDNAEQRVIKRISELDALRKKKHWLKIGILGCMAERMQDSLIKTHNVDLVVGPDSYRDIPRLLSSLGEGCGDLISTELSETETYSEIYPAKINSNGVTAFIPIMRGCENFCSYCVVPYTRGKERSRDFRTIVNEAEKLFSQGYKEVTLLGQNVNSYLWNQGEKDEVNFAKLISLVAEIDPLLRVRFSTSHPKDISQELLDTIANYDNVCKFIHLPLQSGSNRILRLMNRKYTVEEYLDKINRIKRTIQNCSISTDIISGFCTESIEDHESTLNIMKEVCYDSAFMFKYSERPNTLAAKKYKDDVSDCEKTRRLEEIINLQRELSFQSNKQDIGKTFEVLIEGESKRSTDKLLGRNSQNKVILFDKKDFQPGQYVKIKVNDCTSATLFGETVS